MTKNGTLESKTKFLNILLADDDETDRFLVRKAFKKLDTHYQITEASNGEEVLRLLRDAGDDTPPYMILLDLNMPRMGGIEFLEEASKDPNFQRHVVFVFSSSSSPDDISLSYKYNIAGYFMKDQLSKLVEFISIYCI